MKNFLEEKARLGLKNAKKESKKFDRDIIKIYKKTAKEVYGSLKTPGIAVFAYGSPGRSELIGGDSDADIFIGEYKQTKRSKKFRRLLEERWAKLDFSKIDLPTWGTYDEIDTYLEKSLVEGNQVLETRFLIGDKKIKDKVGEKVRKNDSILREIHNIVFNRLYFNQYFRQRMRDGNPNVKYCNGGSRDLLFIYWNNRLNQKYGGEEIKKEYLSEAEKGLLSLLKRKRISRLEFQDATKAIGFMMVFRSDILRVNKNTGDRGLTFFEDKTLKRLQKEFGYPENQKIKAMFERSRRSINFISGVVWEDTMDIMAKFMGEKWKEDFRLAYTKETSERVRGKIHCKDPIMATALIWGASEAGHKEVFSKLVKMYWNSDNWGVLGSFVCSPLCDSKTLHHFTTSILKEEGYGYLLRVVARNKNVSLKTLKNIAYDKTLEKRYSGVAKAALIGGNSLANNQI